MTHFGKRQASLVNELGLDKATAQFLWHSKQPYKRDYVNRIAAWLGLKPFELLMAPSDALALRRLRETAYAIVSQTAVAEPAATPFTEGNPVIARKLKAGPTKSRK